MTIPMPADVIATVRNSDDLVEALRAIKGILALSNEFCDQIGGLTAGHTDKILGPTRAKNLGPMTFDLFCELFAVEFRMHVNIEAAQRMAERWEGREMRNVRVDAHRMSKPLIERAKPHVFREMSALAATARKTKISPEKRTKIARKASRARWRKQRERERAL